MHSTGYDATGAAAGGIDHLRSARQSFPSCPGVPPELRGTYAGTRRHLGDDCSEFRRDRRRVVAGARPIDDKALVDRG